MDKTKTCTSCNKELPVSEYHKTSRKYFDRNSMKEKTYVYLHAKCRNCRNKTKREYDKNRKQVNV